MTYSVFLDDERYPPLGSGMIIARDLHGFIELVQQRGELPSFISFDHDLGENEPTGYDVAKWIVSADLDGSHRIPDDFGFYVHSMNPIGAENIRYLLRNYLENR